jgi:DNA-binding NarL/FixJ family response regulator
MTVSHPSPVRVLIADDHQMVREWFELTYKKDKDLQVIGAARNGAELITLAAKLKPDVIITDIRMPTVDGILATGILKERFPHIPVIAFSIMDGDHYIIQMLEAGARGYLHKSATKEELIEATKTVLNHKPYYCRETTARLAELIAKSKFNPRIKKEYMFSKRETEIICLICDGKSTKEIATTLNLSVRTAERYREKIEREMQVSNTAGIVVCAVRAGIYKINYDL